MNLPAILKLAKSHSTAALIATPLLALWKEAPAEASVMEPWERADAEAAYRHLSMSASCQELSDWMEHEGIWHMPLKGSLLCELYPLPHQRERCDIDILFDPSYREQLRARMEEHGFSFTVFEHHDIYRRPPVLNFEMHRGLAHRDDERNWVDYFEKVRERLVPAPGRSYELRFTKEEFYAYIALHAVQHVREGGTGLRTLTDFGILLKTWGETLDWQQVETMLETLGITQYEHIWRSLATKLFSGRDYEQSLTADEFDMLTYMLSSGTYGSLETKIQLHVAENQAELGGRGLAKLAYIGRRAFPSYESMSRYHEELREKPWLLPFYWGERILRALGDKRKRSELRQVISL